MAKTSGLIRVLFVAPTFYPATFWGGPAFSNFGLCNGLAKTGQVNLRVLTTDAASSRLDESIEVTSYPIQYDAGYEVFFDRRRFSDSVSPKLIYHLFKQIRWADIVHLSSTYNFPTIPTLLLAKLMGKPLVWTPRGAIQATAQWKASPNALVKRLFERVCSWVAPREMMLHLTSREEEEWTCSRLPKFSSVVIPNGVDLPANAELRTPDTGDCCRLMFLSRLHEKKGLENLLGAMTKLPDRFSLDIYGAGETAYESKINDLIEKYDLQDRVRLRGEVLLEAKTAAFVGADIFVLPSYSENFGIVIAEALAHGLPVIVSKATPWSKVEEIGCGLWIDNDCDEIARAALSLDAQDRAEMGRRGSAWIEAEFGWRSLSRKLLNTYKNLLSTSA